MPSYSPRRASALALAAVAFYALPTALVRLAHRLRSCIRPHADLYHLAQAQEWTEDNYQITDPSGPYCRRPVCVAVCLSLSSAASRADRCDALQCRLHPDRRTSHRFHPALRISRGRLMDSYVLLRLQSYLDPT